jgi:hypothetical protein
MKRLAIFALLFCFAATVVCGQDKKSEQNSQPSDEARREGLIERRISVNGTLLPPTSSIYPISFGKTVKGAPYSAEAVTESVQTLADGNRIVRRTTAKLYRDGEGRTRRETILSNVKSYATSGDAPQIISINDPVAQAAYTLDSRKHTAHKTPFFHEFVFQDDNPPMLSSSVNVLFFDHFASSKNAKITKESLGTQVIEGVAAEGTRTTLTIPAGEIGNERAIEVVDEHWYAPELQIIVLSKHSDPRTGETTYRLININRSAPDPSLFQVPAGYAVTDFESQFRQLRKQTERLHSDIQHPYRETERMKTEKKVTEKKESKPN